CRIAPREIVFGIHDEGRLAPDQLTIREYTKRRYTLNGVVGTRARSMLPDRIIAAGFFKLAVVAKAETSSVPGKAEAQAVVFDCCIGGIDGLCFMQEIDQFQSDPEFIEPGINLLIIA